MGMEVNRWEAVRAMTSRQRVGPIEESMDVAVQVTRIELEKIKIACQTAENPIALNGLRMEQREDMISGQVIRSFHAHIYGRKVQESEYADPVKVRMDVVEYVPVSWWDHLKVTIVERWPWTRLTWKKRDVVAKVREETTIHKVIYHTCPHMNMETPGRHLQFLQYDGADGYIIAGLEDKARQAAELWMRNRHSTMPSPELDRCMYELHRITDSERH